MNWKRCQSGDLCWNPRIEEACRCQMNGPGVEDWNGRCPFQNPIDDPKLEELNSKLEEKLPELYELMVGEETGTYTYSEHYGVYIHLEGGKVVAIDDGPLKGLSPEEVAHTALGDFINRSVATAQILWGVDPWNVLDEYSRKVWTVAASVRDVLSHSPELTSMVTFHPAKVTFHPGKVINEKA